MSKAKTPRGSFFLERFISTNYELFPYLTESEKVLMQVTLNNTLKNQKVGELKPEDLQQSSSASSSKIKIKKNKSVKISEKNNSYHYINVKSEII